MSTSSCYFEGTLYVFLTSHIGEVEVEFVLLFKENLAGVIDKRLDIRLVRKKINDIKQCLHAIDVEIVYYGCFMFVFFWNDKTFETFFTCLDSNGKRTLYSLQFTIESQLSHHHVFVQVVGRHTLISCK